MNEMLQYEADHEEEVIATTKSDVIETILYQRALKNAQSALESGYNFSLSFIKQYFANKSRQQSSQNPIAA